MNVKKDIRVGVSVAASWAWGTSLILGMQIAQTKGIIPFLIWAFANSITLLLFGEFTKRGILNRDTYNKKPIKALALVIQMFCLIIQLNIINTIVQTFGVSPMLSYGITFLVGFIFVITMYKKGLPTSMLTDQFQWFIAMGCMLTMFVIGLVSGAATYTHTIGDVSGVQWAVWSAAILLSGPFGDVQHWQRAEENKTGNGFRWASLFFAIYMGLVYVLSLFEFNAAMNVFLLASVLCVTTSTIDSIAVAMHEAANKKVGTAISVFFCIAWGLFAKIGLIDLWSKFGVYRVAFAIIIICTALYLKKKKGKKNV